MEALLQHFHELVTAAADVEQLKKLILRLAFQGELVEQDLNDESVPALLERIEDEREQLVQEKKIKRQKSLPPVMQEEQPYEIPLHWNWVRLGKIGDWGAGATPSRGNAEFYNGEIPWIKTGELNDGYINSSEETITELALSKTSLRLNKPGDVLIAMYGATIGKLGILEIEATTNQACCACTPYEGVLNQYLFYYLLSQRDDFRNQGAGGAQPNISRTKIIHSVFPLAPYREQMRVVKRIKDLFLICDTLKDEIRQKELTSAAMNNSVFARVQDYNNPSQLEDLQFAIENIEHLCNTKEDIGLLRNSILNLAIQGKLVKQDGKDEPATFLLEKINQDKEQLIKVKKIKKDMLLPSITNTEKLFELPHGWEWTRFGEVLSLKNGISKRTGTKGEEQIVLRLADVKENKISLQDCRKIVLTSEELEAYKVDKQGLLFIRVNGSVNLVGKAVLYQHDIPVAYCDHLMYGLLPDSIDVNYFWYMFNSTLIRQQLSDKIITTAGQNTINQKKLGTTLIPIPPFDEQKRIVEKVEQLMALCDGLERNVEESKQEREKMIKAVLQESFTVKEKVLN